MTYDFAAVLGKHRGRKKERKERKFFFVSEIGSGATPHPPPGRGADGSGVARGVGYEHKSQDDGGTDHNSRSDIA
jgi:hypothetical protein